MEVRKTLLPHDLQYCLDGAAENCGITAAAEIAVRLYGDAARLDAIWNEDRPERGGRSWRIDLRRRELEIERYGAEIIRQLPAPRRAAIIERGVLSLVHDVVDKAEWMADAHYEDMCKGGSLRPFLRAWRLDRSMRPTPKTARRLRSFKAIKRYILIEGDEVVKQRHLFETLTSIPVDVLPTDEDRQAIFTDLDGQMESHRRQVRQAIEAARWQERIQSVEYPVEMDRVLVGLKPGFKAKLLKERKERRRAVKRASMLAAAVLGAATVSAFARGEPVLLKGQEVAISAQLTGRIGDAGHGALRVGLQDQNGTRLAGLCVYQEAPALDQLVSLAMHVKSGCINEVLSTGNLYAIEPAGDAHPVIAAHRKSSAHLQLDLNDFAGAPPIRDERQAYNAGKLAYMQEMRAVYEDIIAGIVFGRTAKIFRQHREALVQ